MTDQTRSTPEPMPPVQALMIGGTGDGSVAQHTVHTPAGQPNIIIQIISPIAAILFSALVVFLTTLVATTSAGLTTNIIPAADFFDLLQKSAMLSVAGSVIDILKNLIVVFTKLRDHFPLIQV